MKLKGLAVLGCLYAFSMTASACTPLSSGAFGQSFASAASYTSCFTLTLADHAKRLTGGLLKIDPVGNSLNIKVTSLSLYSGEKLVKTANSPWLFSFGRLTGGSPYELRIVSEVTDANRAGRPGNVGYAGLITNVASAVPEPSAYALGLVGLLAVGIGAWRRRAAK